MWRTYVQSWKATTTEEKRALYVASLSPGCIYEDPLTRAEDWDELEAYMLRFHEQFPGAHFVTQEFMAYDHRSVARWELRGANETVLSEGISYAEHDTDGRLSRVTGFFETPS